MVQNRIRGSLSILMRLRTNFFQTLDGVSLFQIPLNILLGLVLGLIFSVFIVFVLKYRKEDAMGIKRS